MILITCQVAKDPSYFREFNFFLFYNLGLTAVEKALDSRENKFPSTECIVEAVEICLTCNNCQFGEMNFLQKHGTAMGPI